ILSKASSDVTASLPRESADASVRKYRRLPRCLDFEADAAGISFATARRAFSGVDRVGSLDGSAELDWSVDAGAPAYPVGIFRLGVAGLGFTPNKATEENRDRRATANPNKSIVRTQLTHSRRNRFRR